MHLVDLGKLRLQKILMPQIPPGGVVKNVIELPARFDDGRLYGRESAAVPHSAVLFRKSHDAGQALHG